MAVSITKQLYVAGKHANIDATYGPYDTIQHAIQSIPKEIREVGLTVVVKDANGEGIEYWWKRGIEDADLIIKIDDTPVNEKDLANEVVTKIIKLTPTELPINPQDQDIVRDISDGKIKIYDNGIWRNI